MDENTTALFGMIFVFGLPMAAFIVSRVLKHQERMELLRRGIIPPPDNKNAYKAWQKSGSAWQTIPPPAAGPGPVPPQRGAGSWSPDDDPQRALFRGIRTAFIGLAILIGLSFIGGTPGSSAFHGGPWLLGGLIPMFVGIAQIIIAVLSGAELPGVQPRGRYMPPPGMPGPGSPPPPPGFNGTTVPPPPWASQPGRPRFEELSKPAPPPDAR